MSTDDSRDTVLDITPPDTTMRRLPRPPPPAIHKRADADTHRVVSHPLRPVLALQECREVPKSAPCSVENTDPVLIPLLRRRSLSSIISNVTARVKVPLRLKTVITVRTEPATLDDDRQRSDDSDTQMLLPQLLRPTRDIAQ